MNDEWVETTLGKVLDPVKDRVGESESMQILSVTEKRGIIPQEQVFKKRIATEDISKYKVLRPLDIAYNPYLLWTGAVGQWLGSEPGATSPVYECFRAKEEVDPRYIGLVLESGLLTPYFDSTAIGSIRRRRRTTPAVFNAASISLPPLPVQRRIVDLMAHLDNHLANLQTERDAAAQLLSSLLSGWDNRVSHAPLRQFGDLCTPRSGPSWKSSEETAHKTDGAKRVIKITNTRPDGSLDMSDETYVVGLPESVKLLNDRSLIIVRTNGNRDRIGNVYRPTPDAYGCAVSAFQFQAECESSDARDWLFWWLTSPARQRAMSEAASGTTGLGNLAAGWLKKMQVPWPTASERADLLAPVEALSTLIQNLGVEYNDTRILRSATLQELLAADCTIDPNYDSLLSEVA